MKPQIYPLALLLVACASPSIQNSTKYEVNNALAKTAISSHSIGEDAGNSPRGSALYANKLAAEQSNMRVLKRSKTPWLGSQMVPTTNEDKLPSIFKQKFTLAFDDKKVGRMISLTTIATRLSAATGVAVRVQPDATESGIKANDTHKNASVVPMVMPMDLNNFSNGSKPLPLPKIQLAEAPTQSTNTVDSLDMNWNGTLVGFLNHLTDRLGLAWEFRDNTVVIMKYVTESHEIATFSGESQYAMNTGGSSSGSSGGSSTTQMSSSQLDVNEKGKTDAFGSIERAIREMVSSVAGSTVTRADGSGRIVVKTSREMQAQIRDFLKTENASMLRQVQIQFDIYSVSTQDGDEFGINWNGILNTLSNMYSLKIGSPTSLTDTTSGNIGLSILSTASGSNSDTTKRFANSAVMLNLLNQYGTSVQHRPVTLIARNRTWARKSSLNTEGYLSETTPGPASTTGIGAPGLKTDKVTTGDQYVALPQILDNNTVLLKFGVSLSDLLGLFDVTVGSGATLQKVQVPRIHSINDQYEVALKPGEIMAITGFSRIVTTSDQRSLAEGVSIGLGGSRKLDMTREHFVVFVRPVIL